MAVHHRNGKEELVIVLGKNHGGNQANALVREVNYALNALIGEVDDDTQEVFDEVGKEAAAQLETRSRDKGWKKYARGWKYERQKAMKGKKLSLVRNTTQPQLTHLLEYGHPIWNQYGETNGVAKPQPHIQEVNDWVQSELPRKLTEKLKKLK